MNYRSIFATSAFMAMLAAGHADAHDVTAATNVKVKASNPLSVAEFYHSSPSSTGSDKGGQYHNHDASCVLRCGFMANAALGASSKPADFVAPACFAGSVVWRDDAPTLSTSRTYSKAKARAPPSIYS